MKTIFSYQDIQNAFAAGEASGERKGLESALKVLDSAHGQSLNQLGWAEKKISSKLLAAKAEQENLKKGGD